MTQSKSIKIKLARGDLTAKNMDIIVNLFEVPPGTTVPKHTHPGEEIVYVIDDGGTLREPSGILVTTPIAAPFGFAFTPTKDSWDGFRVKFHPLVMTQEVKVVAPAPWGHHP